VRRINPSRQPIRNITRITLDNGEVSISLFENVFWSKVSMDREDFFWLSLEYMRLMYVFGVNGVKG
jgi:hypothetical protein